MPGKIPRATHLTYLGCSNQWVQVPHEVGLSPIEYRRSAIVARDNSREESDRNIGKDKPEQKSAVDDKEC
jgi:hypothetical protein